MEIRAARPADAVEACRVLRRSISELCEADHHNDPVILNQWLANKTPANIQSWIESPHSYMFVALNDGVIVGVAGLTSAGDITLNYVSPDTRFQGISKALLAKLEAKAAELGHARCTLTSTATAREFYRSAGYMDAGPLATGFFTQESLRMVKTLFGSHQP